MRKLQYAVVGAAMLILLAVSLLPLLKSEQDRGVPEEETYTVALVPSGTYSVLSRNPLTVKKGETAEFTVRFETNHICVESDQYQAAGDRIIIENITSDRTYMLKTARTCPVTLEETAHGSVRFLEDPGDYFLAGDPVTLLVSPEEHYRIDGIRVNEVLHPVPGDGIFTFTAEEPCTVRGVFVGVEKNFVLVKKNIGKVTVTGNTSEGHFLYGDPLVLEVVPTEGILFQGWSEGGFLSKGGTLISAEERYAFALSEDREIYANFMDVNTYSAFFVADEASGEIRPLATLSADEYGELPIYGDVGRRKGYILTGFNTKDDGSGESYSIGGRFVMPHSDLIFYPEWTRCTPASSLTYRKTGNAVEVTGLRPEETTGNEILCLPETIEGLPVTSIAANAFSGNPEIRTAVLPPGIRSVGDRAFFGCASLQTVMLPDTLTSMGKDCFAACDSFSDLRLLQSYPKIYDLDYDSALAEKYMRLKCTEGPRILLVGGSNLCFGIRSEMLREAFPDYDVVNFSTTHFYGLSPLLDLIGRNVHEGDLVILAPEYYPDMFAARETTTFHNWEYVDCNPDMLKDIDIRQNQSFLRTIVQYCRSKQVNAPNKVFNSNPVYARSGFNEYGDLLTKRTANKVLEPTIPTPGLITDAGMKRINEACRSYAEQGAVCYFTFPPLSLGSASKEGVIGGAQAFLRALEQGLDPEVVTIISDFGTLLFPASFCYGNCYHLSLDGAAIRTEQLIQDLKAVLQ